MKQTPRDSGVDNSYVPANVSWFVAFKWMETDRQAAYGTGREVRRMYWHFDIVEFQSHHLFPPHVSFASVYHINHTFRHYYLQLQASSPVPLASYGHAGHELEKRKWRTMAPSI